MVVRAHGARLVRAIVLAVGLTALAAAPAAAGGGAVLPGSARPHGYSIDDMTAALASFSTSGNDLGQLPDTPFQLLYVADNGAFVPDDGGFTLIGENAFTVDPGTMFFVPLWNADDSPPVAGSFPTTKKGAISYFFDPSQLGAQFRIVVDGQATTVDGAYVGGPVTTAPLPDGGGTHLITLGVFLAPLPPGTHTVTIDGGLFGDLVSQTLGIDFLGEEITYTVNVLSPGSATR